MLHKLRHNIIYACVEFTRLISSQSLPGANCVVGPPAYRSRLGVYWEQLALPRPSLSS